MKFKVGDKVKGLSDTYGFTNSNMYLGEVKKIGDNYIEILILKHKNPRYIGLIGTALSPEGKFEIVDNLTISQLQSEIDKLSNKVQEEYSNVISNRDKVNYLKEQKQEEIEKMIDNPVEVEEIDPIKTYTLKITGTLSQQKALKKFLETNNMKFERVE